MINALVAIFISLPVSAVLYLSIWASTLSFGYSLGRDDGLCYSCHFLKLISMVCEVQAARRWVVGQSVSMATGCRPDSRARYPIVCFNQWSLRDVDCVRNIFEPCSHIDAT